MIFSVLGYLSKPYYVIFCGASPLHIFFTDSKVRDNKILIYSFTTLIWLIFIHILSLITLIHGVQNKIFIGGPPAYSPPFKWYQIIHVLNLWLLAAGRVGASVSQICWRTVGRWRALHTQWFAAGRPVPLLGMRPERREWRDEDVSTQLPHHKWGHHGHGNGWSYGMSMMVEWAKRGCQNPCNWKTLDQWNPWLTVIDGWSTQESKRTMIKYYGASNKGRCSSCQHFLSIAWSCES